MARNSSIVLDIGAKVDKSVSKSFNQVTDTVSKLGKNVSSNAKQYSKSTEAMNRYSANVSKLNDIINNGDSTTMRYTEKIRYLTEQNKNLETSTESAVAKIKELREELKAQQRIVSQGQKGNYAGILTTKDTRGVLKKAKDEDFMSNPAALEKQLSNLRNEYTAVEKRLRETEEQIELKKGKKGVVALREQAKELAKTFKNVKQEITAVENQLSSARTVSNLKPNSSVSALIEEKALSNVEKAKAKINSLTEAIARQENTIERNKQKQAHNNSELAITEQRSKEYYNSLNENLDKYNNKVNETKAQSQQSLANIGKSFRQYLFSKATSAINGVIKALSRLGRTAIKTLGRMSGIFSKTVSQAVGLQKAIRLLVQYGFGFRSLYYLVRRFRTGIQQGFEYLGGAIKSSKKAISGFSEEVGELLDTLKELMYYLKSAAAAMLQPFMPLINSIIPKLVEWFNRLAITVANFIATLTGQSKIYVASTNLEDYANALDQVSGSAEKANEALGAYDKLNVIGQDKGGGAGGELDTSGWFSEQPVEPSTLAQMIKEAWEKADFTAVGVVIAERFQAMLQGIDWDGTIYPMLEKVAKSVSTFINGFVSVEQLGADIGDAIAKALNGVADVVYTFASTLNWADLGKFIVEGINQFFETFDATLFGQALHDFIDGILTVLGTIFQDTDSSAIGDDVGDFFSALDLGDLSTKLLNVAKQFAVGFANALANWAEQNPESFGIAKALLIASASIKAIEVAVPIALALGTAGVVDFGAIKSKLSIELAKLIMSAFSGETLFSQVLLAISEFFSGIATAITPYIAPILAVLGAGLIGEIANSWEEGKTPLENILVGLGNAWNNLYYNIIQPIINLIKAIVIPIWNALKEAFVNVGGSLSSILIPLCQIIASILSSVVFPAIKTVFDVLTQLWGFISPVITSLISFLGTLLSTVLTVLSRIINAVTPVVQGIVGVIGQVIAIISGGLIAIITALGNKWKGIWEGIKTITRNVANTIIGIINRLLSGFERMINNIVNGLNKLSWDAPGWLTKLSGIQSFGFNLPNVTVPQIPTLAQGAVIPPNREFLAMLGDQSSGTNVEAPLETIKQALVEALGENGRNSSPIVLQLDGKVIARAVWDENEKRYKQLGKYAY